MTSYYIIHYYILLLFFYHTVVALLLLIIISLLLPLCYIIILDYYILIIAYYYNIIFTYHYVIIVSFIMSLLRDYSKWLKQIIIITHCYMLPTWQLADELPGPCVTRQDGPATAAHFRQDRPCWPGRIDLESRVEWLCTQTGRTAGPALPDGSG